MSDRGVPPDRAARARAGRAVIAAVIVATVVGLAVPVMAQEPASATVSPTTGLVDGQLVTVTGTGFAPNGPAYVGMCAPGATGAFDCDSRAFLTLSTDASGSFTADFPVIRFLRKAFDTTSPPIDCALVTCSVGAADFLTGSGSAVYTDVELADVPPVPITASVSPDRGLVDGQVVQVTGAGFRANESVRLRQCPPGATTEAECEADATSAVTDPTGTLQVGREVDRIFRLLREPFTQADCAAAQCTLGIASIAGFSQIALDFAEPSLGISIDPYGTLKAGTDDVVAQATITCDVATPVALFADIVQPGVQYRYVLNRQQCTPGEPLLAFLPSRNPWVTDASYALGSADVSISAVPLQAVNVGLAGLSTEATSAVQLIDQDSLVAVIQAGLADPEATELRAQVQRAIMTRIAQDPVFRQEFAALIAGGA